MKRYFLKITQKFRVNQVGKFVKKAREVGLPLLTHRCLNGDGNGAAVISAFGQRVVIF